LQHFDKNISFFGTGFHAEAERENN